MDRAPRREQQAKKIDREKGTHTHKRKYAIEKWTKSSVCSLKSRMVLTFTFLSCCARFMLLLSLFLYLPSFLPLLSHLLSLIDMTGQRCSFTWALSARGCKVSRERGDKQEILYYDFLIAHIFFFFLFFFCVCVLLCFKEKGFRFKFKHH